MPILVGGSQSETGGATSVKEMCIAAMQEIGVLAGAEEPHPDDLNDVLMRFNQMMGRWGAKKLMVPASTSENFSLEVGTASYSMGSGGTASSVRATQVTNCFIRDSGNIDHPVDILSEEEYNEITDKTLQGRPYKVFYDPSFALGYLRFYYTPDAVETVYIESIKPLTGVTLANVTNSFNLPREYDEAVRLNLAVRISRMFGKSVTPDLATDAEDAYNDILILNASNKSRKLAKLDIGIPSVVGPRYDINAG